MKKPFNIRTYGFWLVLANLSYTWYVRALNGRSILYLNWDKFLNFQESIKSQNVQIEAFWEITRVRNSISKVRTCKHKQWNFDCLNGICILTDFFWMLWTPWHKKKLDRNGPLKVMIKLQWASFFLESSIMIDDRMNKKEGSSLELSLISSAISVWA